MKTKGYDDIVKNQSNIQLAFNFKGEPTAFIVTLEENTIIDYYQNEKIELNTLSDFTDPLTRLYDLIS